MKKLSTRNIITVFFVIAISVTGFFVAAAYKNMRQTQLQNSKASISTSLMLLTEKLHSDASKLDEALIGYVFNSKDKYNAPLAIAIDSLKQDSRALRLFDEKDSSRKNHIDQIVLLTNKKVEDAIASRSIFDRAGEKAFTERINTGNGRMISEELKESIRQLESTIHRTITASHAYLESIATKTTYRFFALAFIFLVILVFFLLNMAFDFKRNEKVAAQLRYQASLTEAIPDAIFTTDKNFVVKSWNRFAAELYGIKEKEALNQPISSLITIHSDETKRAQSLLVLNTTGSYKDEYQVTKRNGEQIAVLASVNTIADNEGIITGYVAIHRDITVRKKLEDKQKEFNQELARQVKLQTAEITNILERITDGFLALNNDLTFTFVNKRAGEILGHTPAGMIGKNIFIDFPQTASSSFNAACERAYNSQQYVFLENYYEPLQIWIENYIYPSADGLSVFFKDITFKKKAETALKESEERYRHLIEHIHAGVVVHNPDSSIVLYNNEAIRLLGLDPLSLTGKKATDPGWCFVDANAERVNRENYPVTRVINTHQPINNLIAGIDRPGGKGRVWVLINAYPEFDENNQMTQVVVTFVDITDRKKAEEELKRSEENLNMAQKIARIGSWEFSLVTGELKWSEELYRIFELEENTPNEELYTKYRSKFHPDDLAKLDSMIQHAIENKKGYTYQHRIIANNGTIKHILGIGEIIQNNNGDIIGLKGTGQDISDIIKAEEKLQNSYKQIKQLVTHLQEIREQERTNMAREIHDELGQQLTGLKMYISWLNKKVTSPEKDIREKFDATIELIEETIKSVRKISMDLRPSMLDDLGLLAALEWQSAEFEKRSGINTEFINQTGNRDIPPRLKTGLFRIYQESLTNVARHADAKKIVSSLKFDNNDLVLTISDDGKGFAFRNIESKKTLGLFGMKERTIEMGGRYEIISEPGKGTTVSVTIPVNT